MAITVKKGDTLWKIAKRLYGDPERYREIARLNGISDPNKIQVGQVLKLPEDENAPKPRMRPQVLPLSVTTEGADSTAETTVQMTGTVQPGEFAEFSPAMQENASQNPNVARMLRKIQSSRKPEAEPEPLSATGTAKKKLRERLPAATYEEGQASVRREATKSRFDFAVGDPNAKDVDPRYLGVTKGDRKPWSKTLGMTDAQKKEAWLRNLISRQSADREENGPLPMFDPRYFE